MSKTKMRCITCGKWFQSANAKDLSVTLLKKDVRSFEPAMAEAEELASTIDPAKNSIHGHYNLGLVYEEYAKNYTAMGKTHKALEPNSTKWPSKPLQTGINTFI